MAYKLTSILYSLLRVIIVFSSTLFAAYYLSVELNSEYLYALSVISVYPMCLILGYDTYILNAKSNINALNRIKIFENFSKLMVYISFLFLIVSNVLSIDEMGKVSIYTLASILVASLTVSLTYFQRNERADIKVKYLQLYYPVLRLLCLCVLVFFYCYFSEINELNELEFLAIVFVLPLVIVFLYSERKNKKENYKINLKQIVFFISTIKRTWPFGAMAFSFIFLQNFTMIISPSWVSSSGIEEFGLAQRFGFLAMVPVVALSSFYNAKIAKFNINLEIDLRNKVVIKSTIIYCCFVLSFIFLLYFYKDPFNQVLSYLDISVSSKLILLSLLPQLVIASLSSFGFILTINKRIFSEFLAIACSSILSMLWMLFWVDKIASEAELLLGSYSVMVVSYAIIRYFNFIQSTLSKFYFLFLFITIFILLLFYYLVDLEIYHVY